MIIHWNLLEPTRGVGIESHRNQWKLMESLRKIRLFQQTLLTGLLFSYSYRIKIDIKINKINIDALLTDIGGITSTVKLKLMFAYKQYQSRDSFILRKALQPTFDTLLL